MKKVFKVTGFTDQVNNLVSTDKEGEVDWEKSEELKDVVRSFKDQLLEEGEKLDVNGDKVLVSSEGWEFSRIFFTLEQVR